MTTEPQWLSDLRGRVALDAELRGRLLEQSDPDAFAQTVAALVGPELSGDDVLRALQEARRQWLERWIS